jgi:hypothetical protein
MVEAFSGKMVKAFSGKMVEALSAKLTGPFHSLSRIPHREFNFLITGRIKSLLRVCRYFARGL